MDQIHAERREPSTPTEPLDMASAVNELLETAASQSSGRAARTLTPGTGSRLKQTLLALKEGRRLDEHVAPGQATVYVLQGSGTLNCGDQSWDLTSGSWAVVPSDPHDLVATSDFAALLTTVTNT